MDFNIEIRKKQLENLDQVISSSRERINSILKFLGWDADKVQKAESLVHCPIDPNHRISPNCWNNHIEKCLLKREGYNLNEQFLSESLTDPSQSIYIDQNRKIEIIRKELMENPSFRPAWNGLEPDPRTSNRYIATYSPDERLAFYNYTIQNTAGPQTPPEFTTVIPKKDPTDKSLSYKELLAMERDAKRRRIKYRSVHLNRKNHTEIIREVINNQMDEYQEYLLEKERKDSDDNNERNSNERPNSSISRHSTHSGSSSRKHDDYKQNKYKNGDNYHRRSSRRSYDNDYDDYHHRRRRRSRSYERHRDYDRRRKY